MLFYGIFDQIGIFIWN